MKWTDLKLKSTWIQGCSSPFFYWFFARALTGNNICEEHFNHRILSIKYLTEPTKKQGITCRRTMPGYITKYMVKRDQGNTFEHVVNAARMIPNHQICIIPNTTHTVFLENFRAVWAGIVPFLKAWSLLLPQRALWFSWLYPCESGVSTVNGCIYFRLPVALYKAFATAPKTGGNGGSPRPVGSISFWTKCTSIFFGASWWRMMR